MSKRLEDRFADAKLRRFARWLKSHPFSHDTFELLAASEVVLADLEREFANAIIYGHPGVPSQYDLIRTVPAYVNNTHIMEVFRTFDAYEHTVGVGGAQ